MALPQLKTAIEGLLFMAGENGLTGKQLADILETDLETAEQAAYALQTDLVQGQRGVLVSFVAGAFRLTTNPAHAPYFERMAYIPSHSTLSQAAIETLSIIAYRQPITRVEIEEIRGVRCDRPITTLMNKELIKEVGRAEVIGRPILYGTTQTFLDYFNLPDLKDLPEPPVVTEDMEEQTYLLFDQMEGRAQTMKERTT